MDQQQRLQVKIFDKSKVFYEGGAWAVSSTNEIGPFDILSEHANFITVFREYVTVHKDEKNMQKFDFEKGIFHVRSNIVEVYVGI